jgi:hypothetical protein
MAREAAAGRLRARYRKLRAPRSGASTGGGAITDSIQSVNDNAGFRYVPGRYSGPATLFKPRRNYSAFNDEKMGWGAVLEGKVEVVELDMNPHAMLVDPFVRLLAGAINQRLMRLYPDGDSVEPVGDPNPDLP